MQTLLTHLEDAENDLLLSDVLTENPDMPIPMLVGESFVHFSNDEVQVSERVTWLSTKRTNRDPTPRNPQVEYPG